MERIPPYSIVFGRDSPGVSGYALVGLRHARRLGAAIRALVRAIGDTDRRVRPDVRARQERVGGLDRAVLEVELGLDAAAGIPRRGRVRLLARRGGGRGRRRARRRVVRAAGDAERRPRPDVVAGDECVGEFQGARDEVVLGLDLRAVVPCGAVVRFLARWGGSGGCGSGRWSSRRSSCWSSCRSSCWSGCRGGCRGGRRGGRRSGRSSSSGGGGGGGGATRTSGPRSGARCARPRTIARPTGVPHAILADLLIWGHIETIGDGEEVDPSLVQRSHGVVLRRLDRVLPDLVREREVLRRGALGRELVVEIDRPLLVRAGPGVARVQVPDDDRLAVLGLDVRRARLVDCAVRGAAMQSVEIPTANGVARAHRKILGLTPRILTKASSSRAISSSIWSKLSLVMLGWDHVWPVSRR